MDEGLVSFQFHHEENQTQYRDTMIMTATKTTPPWRGVKKKETYVMGMTLTRNSQRHSNVCITSPVGLNLKVPLPSTPRRKTNKKNSRANGAANKRTTPSSQEACVCGEGQPNQVVETAPSSSREIITNIGREGGTWQCGGEPAGED
jgi:hypothetical protein